ncbi:MAG: autotransporter-associated beta strand repeat-containing protein [Verrucomicrobiota bacterium]
MAQRLCGSALVFVLSTASLSATLFTWNGGGGDGNWGTGGNWGGSAPTSSNLTDLVFAGSTNLGTAGTPLNQNIATPFLLNSLTFASGGGAFFLGGGALRFDGGISNAITQNSSSAESIANAIQAPSSNSTTTLTLAGTGTGLVTLSGVIAAGPGQRDYALIKTGSSTFALTGVNTYGGGTTINGGILQINTANSLGTGAATINAGTLDVTASFVSVRNFTLGNIASTVMVDSGQTFTANGAFSSTGTLNKTGAGTMILGGANTHTGGTNISAGTLRISSSERLSNNGTLTVSGGAFDLQTFSETVGSVSLTGGSIMGTGLGTLTGSSYSLQSGTVSAILAGSAAVTKTSAGTVTLSGANTYSGGTSVNGGVLALTSSGALGSSGLISFSGGTLQFSSSNATDYSARFSSALNQAVSLDTNGQNVVLGTAFTSTGGSLRKTGAGTITLSIANSYTGTTTVSGGTLQVNVNNALGTAAAGTTVSSGAALKLNGVNYSTAEALTLNGAGVSNGGALSNTGTSIFTGAITIASNATINAGGGKLTFTGGIAKNGTTLTLAGGGTININTNGITGSSANSDLVVDGTTVVLNAANSYNGPTTVQNSGTLKLGASNVLPTSPQTALTVNTSGVFDMASRNDGVASLAGDSSATIKNSTLSSMSTLTVDPTSGVATTFAGMIAGTNSGAQGDMALTKTGLGTLTLSGTNTFSGSTTISGGTLIAAGASGSALGSCNSIVVNSGGALMLGASDQIKNTAAVTLAGGIFAKGNFSEGATNSIGMGTLTLTASGSHIDFGTGAVGVISFGSFAPGSFTLVIDNWSGTANSLGNLGTDRLIFDSDQASNLASFSFTGFGPGAMEFALGAGYYEIVSVPEVSTYFAGLFALVPIAYMHRRQFWAWLRFKKIPPR